MAFFVPDHACTPSGRSTSPAMHQHTCKAAAFSVAWGMHCDSKFSLSVVIAVARCSCNAKMRPMRRYVHATVRACSDICVCVCVRLWGGTPYYRGRPAWVCGLAGMMEGTDAFTATSSGWTGAPLQPSPRLGHPLCEGDDYEHSVPAPPCHPTGRPSRRLFCISRGGCSLLRLPPPALGFLASLPPRGVVFRLRLLAAEVSPLRWLTKRPYSPCSLCIVCSCVFAAAVMYGIGLPPDHCSAATAGPTPKGELSLAPPGSAHPHPSPSPFARGGSWVDLVHGPTDAMHDHHRATPWDSPTPQGPAYKPRRGNVCPARARHPNQCSGHLSQCLTLVIPSFGCPFHNCKSTSHSEHFESTSAGPGARSPACAAHRIAHPTGRRAIRAPIGRMPVTFPDAKANGPCPMTLHRSPGVQCPTAGASSRSAGGEPATADGR